MKKLTKEGTGEWNTIVRYTFDVPDDYDEQAEKSEAKGKFGLENWAFIAHLCKKYPYTSHQVSRDAYTGEEFD